jgi:dishevelled associated activator of morphogenesis
MNNSNGLKCVISHPNSLTIIAQSLHTTDIPTKIRVLEILGGVCLIPEGHKKVLRAMSQFCAFAGERFRFQTVLAELARDTQMSNLDLDCKTAALAFVNVAICGGPGRDDVVFRTHIRHEFLMLGTEAPIFRHCFVLEDANGSLVHLFGLSLASVWLNNIPLAFPFSHLFSSFGWRHKHCRD